MKRLISIALVCWLAFACLSVAAPDPSGKCDEMYNDNTDAFGDIVRVIPSASPGVNCTWAGMTYANGELLRFKNLASPIGAQMVRINPATGAEIATVPLAMPTPGYVMEGTWDGTYVDVCQYYPTTAAGIHRYTLAGNHVSVINPNPAITGSPRGIAYDGENLWVGYNAGVNTNLYKMTKWGTVLNSWPTNTPIVGSYIGMDWTSNATAGNQLCVIDYDDNKLKRLHAVPGAAVTIVDWVQLTPILPDYYPSLAYDGGLLALGTASSSSGMMWFLDDGFIPLDINIWPVTPYPVIPAPGGSFQYFMNVHNCGTAPRTFQIWNRMRGVNTGFDMLCFGPIPRSLPGLANKTVPMTQIVSSLVPSDTVAYISYIGTYPSAIVDSSYFLFMNMHHGDGGPWISESRCYGDCFDEYAVETTPRAFALGEAYPNPFNPTTTISFTLANAGNIKLTVFDVSGRTVATLVDGYRGAGAHEVTFDGSGLASGIYFYKLEADGFNDVQKIVLMK